MVVGRDGASRGRSAVTLPGHRAGLAPPNAGRKWPPELLSPAEARRLLGQPSRRAPTGIRNRALIAVLWRGGLRVSEALALAPRDVDAAACALAVRHGKGDRHRTVGMDPAAFGLLERWLEERRRLGLSRAPVFCTLAGPGATRLLCPCASGAPGGIDKRVHPHGLRHTCAAELAVEGVGVNLIQAQLGHASLHTTTVYLRQIAPVELLGVMRARAWSEDEHG